jgi:hypothetical protein
MQSGLREYEDAGAHRFVIMQYRLPDDRDDLRGRTRTPRIAIHLADFDGFGGKGIVWAQEENESQHRYRRRGVGPQA